MLGAIYQGFYNLQQPPVFNCASNCTWKESYISLGFQAECKNVTEATYSTRVCTPGYDLPDEPLKGNCNMTSPGNITFNIAWVPTTWSTVLVVKAKSLYSGAYLGGDNYGGDGWVCAPLP